MAIGHRSVFPASATAGDPALTEAEKRELSIDLKGRLRTRGNVDVEDNELILALGWDSDSLVARKIAVDSSGQLVLSGASPSSGASDLLLALSYDAQGNLEYLGRATAGSGKTAAAWQIRKYTYDATGTLVDVQFAGGSSAFSGIWNNRSTYSYS